MRQHSGTAPRGRSLAAATLLLGALVVPVNLRAQSAPESLLPPLPQPEATLPVAPNSNGRPVGLPDPGTCGYWIISGRDCANKPCGSQRDQLKVWRFGACESVRRASLDEFVHALSPGVPVCLMLHGSFVDWQTVCEDARETNRWLRNAAPGIPMHLVFYSWPSDNTSKILFPVDVMKLGKRAANHGFYIADLISLLPCDQPVTLIGHSHGARMTVATLHLLGGGAIDGQVFDDAHGTPHRVRAVLAAAAFDHDWLSQDERYDRALSRAELVLNLRNRRDLALGFYPLHRPFATAAAARKGLVSMPRFLKKTTMEPGVTSNVIEVDVTSAVRFGHIWPHYYGDPAIAAEIAPFALFREGGTR